MAYCEAAQRECSYLDFVQGVKDNAVVLRATESAPSAQRISAGVEAAADKWLNPEERICDENVCAMVAKAIESALITEGQLESKAK